MEEGSAMPEQIDDLIPIAKEIQKQAAIKEAEKAEEEGRRVAASEAEKRVLIEKLSKPSGLTEDDKVKLASTVIQRAVRNGLTEVQVYRFPNSLCTDNGRAIDQQEPGWEKTLTGIAQEIYQLWFDYLKPRGYRIRYQRAEDIGIVIAWGDYSLLSHDEVRLPKRSSQGRYDDQASLRAMTFVAEPY
jgi:hypothetical protein